MASRCLVLGGDDCLVVRLVAVGRIGESSVHLRGHLYE